MQTIYLLFVVILLFNSNNAVIHKRKGADLNDFTINSAGTWQGKWFPHKPFAKAQLTPHGQSLDNGDGYDSNCDGDKDLVSKDFDPNFKQHSYNYLCLTSNHSAYTPNLNTETILVKHRIPPSYVPRAKCLNETITYEEELPTFGAYRLLAPKYGTYKYLPPQRWLRSLAEGAIVMAYHPCANPAQVKQLENIVKNCLYRHIITPTQALTPERPLAVLAWGACLRLSVVDETSVVDFIKTNAKRASIAGDISKTKNKYYTAGLLDEAHLITDMDDSEICGYKEM